MTAASLRAALWALLLGGCGATPTSHVIEGPVGVDRWEPSGAAVLGDRLWVVTDRDGWLAAYALPLASGINRPVAAHRLMVRPKDVKWEGLAPDGEGGLWLLEALDRALWRCPDPEKGCAGVVGIPHGEVLAAIDAALPGPVEHATVEGLAVRGAARLVGLRGYLPKGRPPSDFTPFSLVIRPDGHATYGGHAWVRNDRSYGLSGLAFDGDTLWQTWSFEDVKNETRSGVEGIIARADIDPTTGLPGPPVPCLDTDGKPEGIAVFGDHLVVVFDDDKARKRPEDARAFALEPHQDLVWTWPKAECRGGEPFAP